MRHLSSHLLGLLVADDSQLHYPLGKHCCLSQGQALSPEAACIQRLAIRAKGLRFLSRTTLKVTSDPLGLATRCLVWFSDNLVPPFAKFYFLSSLTDVDHESTPQKTACVQIYVSESFSWKP